MQEKSDLPHIPTNQIIRALHGHGELFLVVVEQRGVGHDDEWDLVAQGFEDGA